MREKVRYIRGGYMKRAAFIALCLVLLGGCSWGPKGIKSTTFISSNDKTVYDKIPVSKINLYGGGFLKEWQRLRGELNIPEYSNISRFEVHYDANGLVRELQFGVISLQEGRKKYYRIDRIYPNNYYQISQRDEEPLDENQQLMETEAFFRFFDGLNLREMKPQGEYSWYVFWFKGSKENYAVESTRKFLIEDGKFTEVGNNVLPIRGYFISSYGMAKVETDTRYESYEGKGTQDYFFDVSQGKSL